MYTSCNVTVYHYVPVQIVTWSRHKSSGRTDRWKDRRKDGRQTISLRLWRGIITANSQDLQLYVFYSSKVIKNTKHDKNVKKCIVNLSQASLRKKRLKAICTPKSHIHFAIYASHSHYFTLHFQLSCCWAPRVIKEYLISKK